MTAIGWLHLEYPFHGDQTLFMMGASSLDHGETLYVDFWDTKQPGIFAFYWLGGRLFGFTEHGVHALELVVLLVLSVAMIAFLRSRLDHPWLAGAAPVVTVAMYYAVAHPQSLTQVEFLAAVPLFICLALVAPETAPRRAWFASGLAAGVAVMMKLVLAPIPVAIWLLASALDSRHRVRGSWLSHAWLPAAAGVATVLAATAVWFAAHGALDELLWTSFVYPVAAVTELARASLSRLRDSALWFGSFFIGPLIFMAMIAMAWKGSRHERWVLLSVGWLVAGIGVILAQSLSWWPYHFLLLVLPVGLLAVRGADGVISSTMRTEDSVPAGAVVAAVFILSLLPGIRAAKSKWVDWRNWQVGSERMDAVAFRRSVSISYDRIWRDTAFLRRKDALAGPIYAFGDPRYLALAGRTSALATNGWSWEVYVDRHWRGLPAALDQARPAYILEAAAYHQLLGQRAPDLQAWIETHYEVLDENAGRIWYRLRSSVDASASGR